MADFLQRLKQRKLVQWAVAYLAAAWVLLQVLGLASDSYGWPRAVMHIAFGVLAVGFVIVLVLAWYHGERDAQRISGPELLLIALVLAVGGGVLWNFSRAPSKAGTANAVATQLATSSRAHPSSASVDAASSTPTAIASSALPATGPIAAQPIPAKSVAVLPFENLSTSKDNAYFADGMQDLILTKLADIGDLKVISRTSTMQYGSHPQNLTLVGKQLGVATILEGSVQKAGNQVLINVQLIDVKTDSHIWAQSYQRTLSNIFGVEGEVADKVAKALNAKLTASESVAIAKVPTRNKQAYQAYLKAIYYLDDSNRTADASELDKSIALTKKAVATDPNFADAWALLALGYQKIGNHDEDAERASLKALAIDPNNADAHTEYAFALVNRQEFKKAIAQAKEGVRLNPKGLGNNAAVGFVYLAAGHLEDADAAYTRCTKLFPRINFCRKEMAGVEMMQRQYATARDTLQYAVDHDPADKVAATDLAGAYLLGWGDIAAAHKVLQGVPAPVASSGALASAWYWLDMYARDYAAALAVIQQAPASWFQGYPLALYQAQVYRAQGDDKRAKQAFAKARISLEAGVKRAPTHSGLYARLSLALAGLGDDNGATMEAQRAIKLGDVFSGNRFLLNLATIEAWTGKTSAALKLLDELLGKPAGDVISVNLLKLDPTWDPIRNDPRFQALLKKYGKAAPSNASTASAAIAPGATSEN